MSSENKEVYSVPQRIRAMENMHILFWLVKDICWCLDFRPLGIAMIFPTLAIAIYIMWKNRAVASELFHNLAITFWIIANSGWMVAEFFEIDEAVRPFCLIPFTLGILLLLYFYLIHNPLQKRRSAARAKMIPAEVSIQRETEVIH